MELREALSVVRQLANQQKALRRVEDVLALLVSVEQLEAEAATKREELLKDRGDVKAQVEAAIAEENKRLEAVTETVNTKIENLERSRADAETRLRNTIETLTAELNSTKSTKEAELADLHDSIAGLRGEEADLVAKITLLKAEHTDLINRVKGILAQ